MTTLSEQFFAIIKQNYPPLSGIVQQNLNEFGKQWANEFDRLLKLISQDAPETLSDLVKSYSRFSLSIAMSQSRFEATGSYENHSYAEVKANYYDNEDFVRDEYMPGLLLSHYL